MPRCFDADQPLENSLIGSAGQFFRQVSGTDPGSARLVQIGAIIPHGKYLDELTRGSARVLSRMASEERITGDRANWARLASTAVDCHQTIGGSRRDALHLFEAATSRGISANRLYLCWILNGR